MEEETGPGPDRGRVKRYNRIRTSLDLAGVVLSAAFVLIVLFSGGSLALRIALERHIDGPYLLALAFALTLWAASTLLSFPLSWYGGHRLEHNYGMSNQTLGAWLWESAKSKAVGLALFIPLLLGFYLFVREGGGWWCFYTGVLLFLFSILITRLAPVLLLPLFFKVEPLDDPELTRRLREAASRSGFSLEGIYRMDLSKKTKKANAALTGLGGSRRILLADTLLENFTPEEIEAVVCHELGHHRLRHIPKLIAVGTLLTFAGLYLTHLGIVRAAGLFRDGNPAYGGLDDPAFLPLFALLLIIYSVVTTPLQNGLSRKLEFEADGYAAAQGPGKEAFISSLERLAGLNLADPDPNPILEFALHSHPSISRRIEAMNEESARVEEEPR